MKDRIIEMLERGERVELECVDPDGFARHGHVNERLLSYGKMNINGYSKGEFSLRLDDEELDLLNICRAQAYINDYELQYFKIKEPECTFNDLIDVAVQAVKDGVININTMWADSIAFAPVYENIAVSYFDDEYADGFEYIKSLYTETFVIESEEDVKRFNRRVDSIVLANGEDIIEDVKFHRGAPYFIGGLAIPVPYSVLKGATVTQKRGDS